MIVDSIMKKKEKRGIFGENCNDFIKPKSFAYDYLEIAILAKIIYSKKKSLWGLQSLIQYFVLLGQDFDQ